MRRRNKSTDSGGTPAAKAGGLSDDLAPGTVLGKYRIVERLGSGGMGSVYKAVHTGIAKAVALKTMSPQLASDPRTAARFLREAASASRLDHPHVVGVTDFGSDLGTSYLVMELLRGEDLAMLIARAPRGLPTVMVADVMLAVCAGVYAAHESGVVHRDLKPPNIFLAQTSLGETVPKVLDFGISKMIEEDGSSPLTNTGMVMGTTHYLSPEQVAGKPADVRSDQFALGVIMYEALTGQRPFGGNSAYEIMRSISEGSFQPPRSLRSDLSSGFEALIVRAMALDANNRFESVHDLGRALLSLASPKRRVMWSDYYERDAGRTNDPRLSARSSEGGETIALDVRPAQLSPTRTQFVADLALPPAKAARAATASETGMVEFPNSLHTEDFRALGYFPRRRRWVMPVVLLGLGAALGGVALWRSPALREKLPEVVRTALERASSSATASVASPPVAQATVRDEVPPGLVRPGVVAKNAKATAFAGGGPARATALAGGGPAREAALGGKAPSGPGFSPFSTTDRSSSWPFDPPSAEDLAAAVHEKDAGAVDGGGAARDAHGPPGDANASRAQPALTQTPPVPAPPPTPPATAQDRAQDRAQVRAAAARAAVRNAERELPVVYPMPRARKRSALRVLRGPPASNDPGRLPAAPTDPAVSPPPPTDPPPTAPEEIPARRYFKPGTAPILD